MFEGRQEDHEDHLNHGGPSGHCQSDGDTVWTGEETAEYFLYDGVVGQEHRDQHTKHQQDVGPQRLRSLSHELLVIEAKQQQRGEEWQ